MQPERSATPLSVLDVGRPDDALWVSVDPDTIE
jgi:hypothetical protein